jgi:hypothetical protein
MRLIIFYILIAIVVSFAGSPRKYVGVKTCKSCHQTRRDGRQYDIWRNSKHAGAFKTLSTQRSIEIAKKKKLKKPPTESPECLKCHTITADEKLKEEGVQCESCHGAGSAYKSNSVMRDKAEAIAAGMTYYKDEAAIEKSCRSCHNEKSPTYKSFDFKSMWGDIKHPVPKD